METSVENMKILRPAVLVPLLAAILSISAFAGPLTINALASDPGPSMIYDDDGSQFGTAIIGPISIQFADAGGAFSGWLRCRAYQDATNTTFIYRIEMDAAPVGASIDKFRLATVMSPHLAIEEIADIGYNTYYSDLNSDAALAQAWCGVDGFMTVIDFDFTNTGIGDNTGLTAGLTTELFLKTSNDVDVDSVYALFLDGGVAVENTISGVVSPGAPPQVPEPATIVMTIGGIVGLCGVVRRKMRR